MKKLNKFLIIAIFVLFSLTFLSACSEREVSLADIIVTFDTDGGTTVSPYDKGVVEEFPVSSKTGFYIENWYSDKEKTNRVAFPFRAAESCKLYAKWVSINDGNPEIEYVKNQSSTAYIAERYNGNAHSVVIPDVHEGFPVIEVSDAFLIKRNYVNTIYLGKNVRNVGKAFVRCSVLKEFNVDPSNAYFKELNGTLYSKDLLMMYYYPSAAPAESFTLNASAQQYTFYMCPNLKELIFGYAAYIQNKGLDNFIAIEKYTVTKENGYYSSNNGCLYTKDMKTLIRCPSKCGDKFVIDDNTERIAENAFVGTEVTEIKIGKSLQEFLDFSTIPNLEKFTVDENNTTFTAIDGVLFSHDGKRILRVPCTLSGTYKVPSGTESIADFAFAGVTGIESVTLAESVRIIDNCAFFGCVSLTNLKCEENSQLEYIDANAFSGCNRFSSMTLTGIKPPQIPSDMFSSFNFAISVIVPKNAGDMYSEFLNSSNILIMPDGFPIPEYTATFIADGKIFDTVHGVYISKLSALPQKENFVFEGWYDNMECTGEKLSCPYIITDHVYFYAFFEEYLDFTPKE